MDDQTQGPVAKARKAGRAEAEAFDAALRREEDRQLRRRRARLEAGEEGDLWPDGGESAPTEVARLQSQVEALARFQAAVLKSTPWRVIQAVRRLFGRAW